jgi:hypothetical protein
MTVVAADMVMVATMTTALAPGRVRGGLGLIGVEMTDFGAPDVRASRGGVEELQLGLSGALVGARRVAGREPGVAVLGDIAVSTLGPRCRLLRTPASAPRALAVEASRQRHEGGALPLRPGSWALHPHAWALQPSPPQAVPRPSDEGATPDSPGLGGRRACPEQDRGKRPPPWARWRARGCRGTATGT